jgi:serine/threonine protein kinase
MKPENVLVSDDGHLKLTDFGLSKEIRDDYYNSNEFCGSHAYLAPEMLENKPHGKSIDWYGIGTILYEFLVGVPPYYNPDQEELYERIKSAPLIIPNFISRECENLMKSLLKRNPHDRIGAYRGVDEIKEHPWFADVSWDDVYRKRTYPKIYKIKDLKMKPEKINMKDLTQVGSYR